MRKRVKASTVINISLAVALLTVVVFGFFFLRQKVPTPVKAIVTTTAVITNQPPKHRFDLYGPQNAPMAGPLGVAVAPDGRVFVADSSNHRIQVFNAQGDPVTRFGKLGQGKGEFNYPTGLIVRGQRLYVADFKNGRIQVLGLDGKPQGVIPDAAKHKDLAFAPLAMAEDRAGNMYVVTVGHEVLVFDKDDRFVKRFAKGGSKDGELAYPNAVAVDSKGRIWVADSNNGRVQMFSPEGRYVKQFGGMLTPRGIAVDGRDRVFIVDTLQHKVFVVDSEGKELFTFGDRGVEEGQFNFPNNIAVGPDGKFYIADRENNRVSVWGY